MTTAPTSPPAELSEPREPTATGTSAGAAGTSSATEMAEATTALLNAATKALEKSSDFLENSSRWTLLFCAFAFGLALAVAPLVLIWAHGDLAATAPEYLATSLIGGTVALAGLVGLIVSDRGTRTAAAAVQETGIDVVAALRERNRTTDGSPSPAKP